MVKVVGYNTISCVPGVMSLGEYDCPTCEPVGEYQVDTSHFVPACEAGALSLSAGDVVGNGAYDFVNGKDTGVKIPRNRLHSYTGDLAEASVNLRQARADSDKSLKDAYDVYQSEKTLESLRSGASGESSASTSSNE